MPENIQNQLGSVVIDDTDGLKELHDWLYERVADDNDVIVDKVTSISFWKKKFKDWVKSD